MVPLIFGRLLRGGRFKLSRQRREGPYLWVGFCEVNKGERLPSRRELEEELFSFPFVYEFEDERITLLEVSRVALPEEDSRYKGRFIVIFDVKEWGQGGKADESEEKDTGQMADLLQFIPKNKED